MQDSWSGGEAYEAYVGRWSRPVARRFLEWADAPRDGSFLDVGCGTGALTEACLSRGARRVVGVDASPAFVEHAATRVKDARASFEVGDATRLRFRDASFDAVVSGLVINFVPDAAAMALGMRRAARPGGLVALYVWDYEEGAQLMRRFWDAAAALDPAAAALDEARRFPLCRPEALDALFREAGLRSVQTAGVEVPTVFRDFADYWEPFLGGQGPAPGYVAGLAPEARERLRERLRSTVPVQPDGSVALSARAWAVRGRA